ncbi:MAG: methyltransferase [Leucobacter sp.]
MNVAHLERLRADLIAARFNSADIVRLWGSAAERSRQRGVLVPASHALLTTDAMSAHTATSALATLARVFLLGETVSETDLELALPQLGAAAAFELGIVTTNAAGMYRAALSLNPVVLPDPAAQEPGETIEWWILSDLDDHLRGGAAHPQHVMGVGGATRSLIAQAPFGDGRTAPGSRALDLGTGCGIVAMAIARAFRDHPGKIVATDISSRALMLAEANFVLNEMRGRIELRQGDLFAPVHGEQFDLIVSNPPFVITPRTADEAAGTPERYEYRDGGMTGDELAARVVRQAPVYLADRGMLVCLANWETPWGGNGLARVGEWIDDASTAAGCALDAWVIERDQVDVAQYAETWARDGGARPGSSDFSSLMSEWLKDFAVRNVVAVGLGSIRVQKTDAPEGVIRTEQAMGMFAGRDLGSSLERAFAAGVRAERMTQAEMLDGYWIRDPRVTEEREHRPGEEAPTSIRLVTGAPIGRRIDVDPLLSAALGACDGDLTLGQLADALATLLEVDAESTKNALTDGMRELAWLGMVEPAHR